MKKVYNHSKQDFISRVLRILVCSIYFVSLSFYAFAYNESSQESSPYVTDALSDREIIIEQTLLALESSDSQRNTVVENALSEQEYPNTVEPYQSEKSPLQADLPSGNESSEELDQTIDQEQESDGATELTSVSLTGDHVEFIKSEDKFVATGNVVIEKGTTLLRCDKVEFSRATKVAIAEGNVVIENEEGRMKGNHMVFNMDTMKGDFFDAKIYSAPFYGTGATMSKVGENQITMKDGFMTTCDHDKPHFHLGSKKIDIYPGDKAVARSVRMVIGKVPILYIPKYVQDLRDNKPMVIITPGYDNDWGAFLLSKWRYYLNEGARGIVRLDWREKKDVASGIDLEYKTKKYGEGMLRSYYMNERNLDAKRIWDERLSPTIEKERYKMEWRHKWDIDDDTSTMWQYYNLSDEGILKDYFKREYEKDGNPSTYFLFKRSLPRGVLSFRTDHRINRFETKTERLPEIQYNLTNAEIGNTGLYFRNVTTYSNLSRKIAEPSTQRFETMRVDFEGDISYPVKLKFLEFRPYVGGRETYYSKTNDSSKYNIIRGVFESGVDISTTFYKIFDVDTEFFGAEINRLRHIVTPSAAYNFRADPTVPSSYLDQFDGSIDSISRNHAITFSLENKLQTKRKDQSVDLARAILSTTYNLKEDPSQQGFDTIRLDVELKPTSWMRFDFDSGYSTQDDRLRDANFEVILSDPGNEKINDLGEEVIEDSNWTFKIRKRLNVDSDDILTWEHTWDINPLWSLKTYQRFDLDTGSMEEQEYTVVRDLHAWEVEVILNDKKHGGSEIMFAFRLKAFPDIGFDFGSRFNRTKTK